MPLIGPLGDLDRLSDELSVATDIGATAAPAATAAAESTATSAATTPTMATALRGMGWAGEAWRHEARQAPGGGGPSTPAATSRSHLAAAGQLQVAGPTHEKEEFMYLTK